MIGFLSRSLFTKLLLTFLLVMVIAFAVESGLAILAGEGAIENLVQENLTGQAQDVLEEVNRYLADRGREVKSWSTLSIMDDVLVDDRTLTIENLLLELQREEPRHYATLTVTSSSNRVIASSSLQRIGQALPVGAKALAQVPGTEFWTSEPPHDVEGAPAYFVVRHPIKSPLVAGSPVGWLFADVRWDPVEEIVAGSELIGAKSNAGKIFLLVDSAGNLLAGRAAFMERTSGGLDLLRRAVAESAPSRTLRSVDDYLVADYSATPSGDSLGQGLRVIALWHRDRAFAVVRIFERVVLGSACLGVLLAAGASYVSAKAIARRLQKLTEGTGRLARGDLTYRVEEGPSDEFGLVARSFNKMGFELESARQGLEAAVARWKALVTYAPDIIMTVSRDGKILFINRVVAGYSVNEVIGSSIYEYTPAAHHERLRQSVERVFSTGEATGLDLEGPGTDGALGWYSTRIGPVIQDGQVVAATIITTDITKRKLLEREILEISELERERIGRDLHDGLGQVLTGVALLSKGLQRKLFATQSDGQGEAGRIGELISDAILQTRSLARGLFPIDLDSKGLKGSLEELAGSVEQMSGITCRVEGELASPVQSRSKTTHLFRIAQEAVSNALRHGKAISILISLNSTSDANFLRIRDDGVGFPGLPSLHEGIGLRFMRYRAGVIGATLEFSGNPAGGTLVTCRFT